MPKSDGYKNLELGRGWNKGKDTRIKLKCAVCNVTIKRYKCQIKSEKVFCSLKCKGNGMSKGLTKAMRLGTGYGIKDILIRRKYYKYRMYDKKRHFNTMDKSVREFVKKINNSKCIYCGTIENLGYDRIDNNKGHKENNVIVCCELCNMTRGNRFTVKQMKKIGKIIASFKDKKGGEKE